MDKIKIGIAGCGSRGLYFAGNLFNSHPDCEVRALFDVNPDKMKAARMMLEKDIPAFNTIDEMLECPDVNTVVIASPDHCHAEQSIKTLKKGKNLFLEKPMAQTIEDCDAIIEAWEQNPVSIFMIGLELRYCSLMKDCRKLINEGVIGDIKLGSAVDNVSVGGNYYFHGARRKKDYVVSLALEKGTHTLDLVNWLIGSEPVKVYASGGLDFYGGDAPVGLRCRDCSKAGTCEYYVNYSNFKMDYDSILNDKEDYCVYSSECDSSDNAIFLIDYANGARMSYTECHFTPEYSREFTFIGTKGKLTAFYNNEQRFKITVQKKGSRKVETYYPEHQDGGHGGGDTGIIEAFIEKIKVGTPSMDGVIDARNSAAIAIAGARSEETGMPEIIPVLKGENR